MSSNACLCMLYTSNNYWVGHVCIIQERKYAHRYPFYLGCHIFWHTNLCKIRQTVCLALACHTSSHCWLYECTLITIFLLHALNVYSMDVRSDVYLHGIHRSIVYGLSLDLCTGEKMGCVMLMGFTEGQIGEGYFCGWSWQIEREIKGLLICCLPAEQQYL